ncbi:FtsE-like ATP binding protein in cell division [Bifidobacterium anseris]|uniref:Cell division ATP-binding protein FtsE n=1 Tax=Bifidobacterium anseris TaxID=2020963 RepID=A0A2N5IYU3_9BIFI|nr:cell division ATP-binding protein FtsE [Bifidobacterium anseris]PLS27114.1 FtsE-like ATP binding protein in cell division [Bifidobacterium anseris]
MALISMDHVSKIYPNSTRPALEDVNLQIDRGDFVFLVGASGSGKTSLLRLLLHEEEATDGEIRVGGYDLRRLPNRQVPVYRRSVGMIFQDYKLLTNKTVWENVAFALEVIGTPRSAIRSLVPKVLKTVGLTGKERNKPLELSGGEQQRVTIARAYVNHPQLLLADEPTGNLDPTTSLGIMEVLDAINRTGTTIVMATHNEEIVNSMRKRVVELHNGRIVRDQAAGVYDSALYFPDEQVAAQAHDAISGDASMASAADLAHAARPKNRRERIERAEAAADAVNDAIEHESSEGIARLAKSVHAGKTGRYGEVFAPVEETLTWGGGLTLDELAQREDGDNANTEATSTTSETVETTETTQTVETSTTSETTQPAEMTQPTETAQPPTPPLAPPQPPRPPRPPRQGARHGRGHDGAHGQEGSR